jgi:microcystin-dependent protein
MSCSNCFNGCTDIISDRCVKYTGVDIPILGIKTGDSLSYIEQALSGFLISALDGSGIIPDLGLERSSLISCPPVSNYLPTCGDLTLNSFIIALIKAACDLQVQIDAINETLVELNADYDIGCLTGVVVSDDTHSILQAVITKLCDVDANLTVLALTVSTNYVSIANIDTYIQAYLDSIALGTLYKNRMVPFTVVEYYGSLGVFDGSGAGVGAWDRIFLCNGANGTPDKRGRVGVGAIVGVVGGGALNAAVDPGITGNPNYALSDIAGLNMITLATSQMPSHTHTTTSTVTDPTHNHGWTGQNGDGFPDGSADRTTPGTGNSYIRTSQTLNVTTGISVSVINATAGSSGSHANIQPVLACYYIMYIP